MTDTPQKNPLIKKAECPCCGNVIEIRKDKNSKAYYNCTGSYEDGTKCRRSVRFSVRQNRRIIEDTQRQQAAKPAPADAGSEEVRDDATPTPPAKPQAQKTEEKHPYD